MSDVSLILTQIEQGDRHAAEQLLPLVYDELRKLAAAKLAQEKPDQTLQATALVHEAYLRLVAGQESDGGAGPEDKDRKSETGDRSSGVDPAWRGGVGKRSPAPDPAWRGGAGSRKAEIGSPASKKWDGRGHFFAAAAEAMRRILVEHARQRASLKRGGQMQRVALEELAESESSDTIDLLALNDALERLAKADAQAAELVKLRYFAGLTMDEAAQALNISSRNAYYTWQYARSWLRQHLHSDSLTPSP